MRKKNKVMNFIIIIARYYYSEYYNNKPTPDASPVTCANENFCY
jgi:hypothetical protein